MEKRILVFDYDGTLADTLDLAFKAFNLICADYGLKKFRSKEEFVKLYSGNFYESLLKNGLHDGNIDKFNIALRDSFVHLGYGKNLFPAVKRVINKLAEDNLIVVITSNITETVMKSINDTGLHIKEVIGGDIEKSKVKKIISLRKKYPIGEMYYIGDTKGDVLEGQRAGVKTVGVTWGYHSRKEVESAEPDFVVDKPDELLKVFS